MIKSIILSITLVLQCIFVSAQTIQPPSPGKAVVYFVRPSGMGFAINFTYYDSANFIGKFNGPKYMRYECNPGKHLFWATSENRDFVEAELNEGKVYFIEAVPQMGAVKAGVQLVPVLPGDSKKMAKIQKLLNKKPGEVFSETELQEETVRAKSNIEDGLERYQKEKSKDNNKKVATLKKEDYATL